MKLLLVAVLAVTAYTVCGSDPHPLSDEFINSINEAQSLWKAGRNFDEKTPMSYIRSLNGLRRDPNEVKVYKEFKDFKGAIPDTFDAREQWPKCESLKHIRDQSTCGSCWAVSAAAAMTDRLCIASNGAVKTYVSAADLMECCSSCGDGCNGGYIISPWTYWKNTGIASGGDYGSKTGCVAYPFPECDHHVVGTKPPCGASKPTPKCEKKCGNSALKYAEELTHGKSAYYVSGVKSIQQEILENGPVSAGFDVFEDFVTYKSGVYKHVKGSFLGGHAVKIIGWGEENGTPYWLIANSWNEDWGDKGLFKILRGSSECGIEDDIAGGLPQL